MSNTTQARVLNERQKYWLTVRKKSVPYLLLAPVVIFVCCFMLWPILNVFKMSTESYYATRALKRHFVGLENFIKIFTNDSIFVKTLSTTLVYVVFSVALQGVFGFWLAYLLTRKFKSRGTFRALSLIPWAVAGLMVGIIWNLMLGQTYGVINDLLVRFHIIQMKFSWFSSRQYALAAIVIANIWRGIPFFAISYMSALSGISDEIYESCKLDGARPWTTMFHITLPMIRDTIIVTTLLRALWTFNAVDLIISLTDGGPNRGTTTLALYIMRTFSDDFNYGYASALSTISTIIMMVFAFSYIKLGKLGKGGIV